MAPSVLLEPVLAVLAADEVRNLDEQVLRALDSLPDIDITIVQQVANACFAQVEAVSGQDRCKHRRTRHRAWLVGLARAATRRGLLPIEVAYVVAWNTLRNAVDHGLILAVFAFSLGWSFAQAQRLDRWDDLGEAGRAEAVRDALERGLAHAEGSLGGEVQVQEKRWMRQDLHNGWRAGAFLAGMGRILGQGGNK